MVNGGADMRRISSSGGSRSFGGSSGGSRSFGGSRLSGGSSTRRISSGGRSSFSGYSSSISDSNFSIVSILWIFAKIAGFLVKIFGPIGATVVGGALLAGPMYFISVELGVFMTMLYLLFVAIGFIYTKKANYSQLDMSFVDDYAGDRRFNKEILYSKEFETYLMDKLRSSKIIDKKNRIKDEQKYALNDAFEKIYKDYLKDKAKIS